MIIPRVGMDCLYVLQAGGDESIASLVVRPCKILNVRSYGLNSATVDMILFLNGSADTDFVRHRLDGPTSSELDRHPYLRIEGCTYSAEKKMDSFHFMDERMYDSPKMERMEVARDIIHGREIIRKGAIGWWDQQKNLIGFPRDFVGGMHPEQKPEWKADEFIDWHVPRLVMPEGYQVTVVPTPLDGKERPHERQEYLQDLMEEWENNPFGLPWPHTVRRRWGRGDFREHNENIVNERKVQRETDKGVGSRAPMLTNDDREERDGREGSDRATQRRELEHSNA